LANVHHEVAIVGPEGAIASAPRGERSPKLANDRPDVTNDRPDVMNVGPDVTNDRPDVANA
jgi:hypothetical protein